MASFDYDVAIIGSGFGGSVAAMRAAEKGYRVGVMESGPRWPDEKIPKSQWDLAHFVWPGFNIVSGAVVNGPATDPLNVYEAREVDGDVQVRA